MTLSTAPLSLPIYDLGPGTSGKELAANVIIYGMLLSFVLALLWLVVLYVQDTRDGRSRD